MKSNPERAGPNGGGVPAYLRLQHLASAHSSPRLPAALSFLLRVITLTDSVMAFNDAKRLTNQFNVVARTVGQIAKRRVTERHYRQIKSICGDIYAYSQTYLKDTPILIIARNGESARIEKARRKMESWVREQYKARAAAEGEGGQGADDELVDELMRKDRSFNASHLPDPPERALLGTADGMCSVIRTKIETSGALPGAGLCAAGSQDKKAASEKAGEKAKPILERIREREEERRRAYMQLQVEKDEEIRKVTGAMYMLYRTENRKTLESAYVSSRLRGLARGEVTLSEVVLFPENEPFLQFKSVLGKDYVVLDAAKYKELRQGGPLGGSQLADDFDNKAE